MAGQTLEFWGQSKYPVVYRLFHSLLNGLTRRRVKAPATFANCSVPSAKPLFRQ